MTQYKLEILHKQGRGYSHLDSPIVSLDDSSASDFKRNVLKVAVNSIEEAEIMGVENPPIQKIADRVETYWDNNIHEHLNALFTIALDRADKDDLIDTGGVSLPDCIDDVPDLDRSVLYDLLEDNVNKPEFYAELRMADSFGVSVVDIHTDDEIPGHDSMVRVIAIKLDGED